VVCSRVGVYLFVCSLSVVRFGNCTRLFILSLSVCLYVVPDVVCMSVVWWFVAGTGSGYCHMFTWWYLTRVTEQPFSVVMSVVLTIVSLSVFLYGNRSLCVGLMVFLSLHILLCTAA